MLFEQRLLIKTQNLGEGNKSQSDIEKFDWRRSMFAKTWRKINRSLGNVFVQDNSQIWLLLAKWKVNTHP